MARFQNQKACCLLYEFFDQPNLSRFLYFFLQLQIMGYTELLGELEHLKIETSLIDEMFASVMGEYVFLK